MSVEAIHILIFIPPRIAWSEDDPNRISPQLHHAKPFGRIKWLSFPL